MSGKFALIIGNTEYTDPGLAQLTAPGKDAEDFARVLKDHDIVAFDEVNILLNQPEPVVRDELGALYLAVKNTIRLRSTAVADRLRASLKLFTSRLLTYRFLGNRLLYNVLRNRFWFSISLRSC